MRNNSIGKIRSDLNEAMTGIESLRLLLKIQAGTVIILSAAVAYLLLAG